MITYLCLTGANALMALTVATVVGLGLQLVVGFFYFASGLVVPAPWLPVLWAVWCGFTAAAIVRRRQTIFVLLTPVAAALFLVVAVSFGGYFLGWTA